MHRTQFTFYESFAQSIKRIKNKSVRADAYDAICNYALYGVEPDLDKLPDAAAIAFIGAKPNLDASRKKAENGKRGGTAKQTNSKTEANGKQEQTESEKEIEIEKEIENECSLSPLPPNGGKSAKAKQDPFVEFAGDNKDLLRALKDFGKMRDKNKKPLTDRAKELTIADLKKLSENPKEWVAILDQSVQRGWQGVFSLKNDTLSQTQHRIPTGSAGTAPLGALEREALARMMGDG
jgi:hypothetical protein